MNKKQVKKAIKQIKNASAYNQAIQEYANKPFAFFEDFQVATNQYVHPLVQEYLLRDYGGAIYTMLNNATIGNLLSLNTKSLSYTDVKEESFNITPNAIQLRDMQNTLGYVTLQSKSDCPRFLAYIQKIGELEHLTDEEEQLRHNAIEEMKTAYFSSESDGDIIIEPKWKPLHRIAHLELSSIWVDKNNNPHHISKMDVDYILSCLRILDRFVYGDMEDLTEEESLSLERHLALAREYLLRVYKKYEATIQ